MNILERINNRMCEAMENDTDEKAERFSERCDAICRTMITAAIALSTMMIVAVMALNSLD